MSLVVVCECIERVSANRKVFDVDVVNGVYALRQCSAVCFAVGIQVDFAEVCHCSRCLGIDAELNIFIGCIDSCVVGSHEAYSGIAVYLGMLDTFEGIHSDGALMGGRTPGAEVVARVV